jgi:hypothetical protein
LKRGVGGAVLILYEETLPVPLIKLIKNKSRHNFINDLSSAKCFGFVSHLQAEYTVEV